MRFLLLAAAAVLLCGCDHMYGAGDVGRVMPSAAPLGSR